MSEFDYTIPEFLKNEDFDLVEYRKGDILCSRDLSIDYVVYILDGEARLLFSTLNYSKTLCRASKDDCIGLVNIISGMNIESAVAVTKIKALIIENITVRRLLRQGVQLSTPSLTYLKYPNEQEYLLSQFISEKLLIEYIKKYSDYKPSTSTNHNSSKFRYSYFKGITKGEWLTDEEIVESSSNNCVRLLDIDFDVLERISEQLPDLPKLKAADFKRQALISFIKIINTHTNNSSNNTQGDDNAQNDVNNYSVRDQICFATKILDIQYSEDALNYACNQIVAQGKEYDLDCIGDLLFSIGINAVSTRIKKKSLIRLKVGDFVAIHQRPGVIVEKSTNKLHIMHANKFITSVSNKDFDQNDDDVFVESLILYKNLNIADGKKFSASWLLPYLKEHKVTLFLVLIASFVIQILGLATPLVIQVIIDKAVSQRSLDTLQVLGFSLLIVAIVEAVLGMLRIFLFTEITNRIDMSFSSTVIQKLFRLPLSYFDKRNAGELSTRFQETEKIRGFMTSQAITTLLDCIFSIVFILVMIAYSPLLTAVALSVLPFQILITVGGSPFLRTQYRRSAECNADAQSCLVEGVTGIQTIKTQTLEAQFRKRWQGIYNNYLSYSFKTNLVGTFLGETSEALQKISQLLVLWIGAILILDGKLSLGQLIAFRIIAGYVTEPILRLSGIWQSFQEIKISFERLGDIVNTREESDVTDQSKPRLPELKGSVSLKNLSFSFNPKDSNLIIQNVNLDIKAGQFVAIVGQSGSGKSTLVKLISRLYEPTTGSIEIDGCNISKIELYSLRNQLGIVPQDSLLFSGSIADNIRLKNLDITLEKVQEAAKIAMAHDFIMQQDDGYATKVTERGSSLSGGQRQRISIARSIVNSPKLLIFDEATSALDFISEKRICENLMNKQKRVTTIFVTHRLDSVLNADMIIVMDEGLVVEQGSHKSLMNNKGKYFSLYNSQSR